MNTTSHWLVGTSYARSLRGQWERAEVLALADYWSAGERPAQPRARPAPSNLRISEYIAANV
jgi:hypothetical protein